jgi:AraC-like DNA-binding protein
MAVAPDLRRRHTDVVNTAIVSEADGLEVEVVSHSWRRSAQSEQPPSRIALNLGFADQSHFSRSFHALNRLTPSQFRRAHRR